MVQIAGQLAKSVVKLYGFWTSLREAPEEVGGIVRGLKCLSTLLEEISAEQYHGHGMISALEYYEHKVKVCCTTILKFISHVLIACSRNSSTLFIGSNQTSAQPTPEYDYGVVSKQSARRKS